MKFRNSPVFRNFIFLFTNQFFNLVIPLLVFPFLIKVLGIQYFGLYSLAYAILIFSFMLCDYGFNFSGSKYIAINRNRTAKRDMAFSSILTIKLGIALVVSLLWIVFVVLNPIFREVQLFALLFIGMIIGNAINLQWFFIGLEQLGWFSSVNSSLKLLSNIGILYFVKSPGDMYLIPLLYSAAFIVSGLITLGIAVKTFNIKFRLNSKIRFNKFIKDGFDNFVAIATTSLIFNGTIIVLGFFEKDFLIIGAFAAIDRIVKILVSMYVPYSTAIYSRNMANFQISSARGIQSVFKYGILAIAVYLVVVLALQIFARDILHFLDPNLVEFAPWLQIFSVWLIFIVVNNLLGYHFLNGLNKSSAFRNMNLIYTFVTLILMVAGCAFFSFKGCIVAVLTGEVFLSILLILQVKTYRSNVSQAMMGALRRFPQRL